MLTEHYKKKCQHRVDKSPSSCTGCKINRELDEPLEVDYGVGFQVGSSSQDINFDAISFAAYRADARTMKEVGNMMINVNKAVNTAIKQEKTWKQLVTVEETIWEERKNKDAMKTKK